MENNNHFTTNKEWRVLGHPFYWEKYGVHIVADRYTEYGTLQYKIKRDGCERYVGKILDNAMIFIDE